MARQGALGRKYRGSIGSEITTCIEIDIIPRTERLLVGLRAPGDTLASRAAGEPLSGCRRQATWDVRFQSEPSL